MTQTLSSIYSLKFSCICDWLFYKVFWKIDIHRRRDISLIKNPGFTNATYTSVSGAVTLHYPVVLHTRQKRLQIAFFTTFHQYWSKAGCQTYLNAPFSSSYQLIYCNCEASTKISFIFFSIWHSFMFPFQDLTNILLVLYEHQIVLSIQSYARFQFLVLVLSAKFITGLLEVNINIFMHAAFK